MKAKKRNLSRAEKIRQFIRKNPGAPISYIASQFDTTYHVVYMIKRNMEGRALKKPKVTKEMMQSVVDDLKAKREEKKSPLDTMPKVGDTVGGLTLTRVEKDGQYQYSWVRKAPELPITMEEPKSDPVNHPAHYKVGGIETIDYIKAKLTPEEFRGYLKGNLLKYSSRIGHKGAAQIDAGKAGWYANALVQAIEGA